MSSYILLIYSFIVAIVAVIQNNLVPKDKRSILGLTKTGATLVLISIAAVIVSFFDIYTKQEKENEVNTHHQEALVRLAKRAEIVIKPTHSFLQHFLSSNNRYGVFDSFERESRNRDDILPSMIEPIKEVFLTSSMQAPSPLFDLDYKPISYSDYFHRQINEVYQESDSFLDHYGNFEHPLVDVIEEIRIRSEIFVRFLPIIKELNRNNSLWKSGVLESWANLIQYFYFNQLEAHCLIKEIRSSENN